MPAFSLANVSNLFRSSIAELSGDVYENSANVVLGRVKSVRFHGSPSSFPIPQVSLA